MKPDRWKTILINSNRSYSPKKISVVVPTKNEGEVIHECLSSVFDQSVKPFEVIVVDGRSTDDTLEKACQFPVKILVESEPTSPANARNLGIQNAKGEVLLIMDADVILSHDCLKYALQYFHDSNVAAVIPSQEVTGHTRLEKIQASWFLGTSNPIRMGIGTVAPVQFLRKDILSKINFDPSLGYGDDADFQDRLQKLCKESRRIVYASDIKISVRVPHTLRELWLQYVWYGRTFLKYFLKHHSVKTFLNLISLLMPAAFLIICIASLILPFVIPLVLLGLLLLVMRNLIACFRSKSTYIVDFLFFEFVRSIFFICGIIQGFFSEQTGR